MVIVSVTRGDLRDESVMADEAFALSPISARASLPSEEDYDAISHAFMETSRGRWFLGEYAKRNRNADTRMVLDAVARIEETIAAHRQPAAENGLAEALAAIRRAVDEAQVATAAAFDTLALEENLAPIRKGARIIREISWRWREIGADSRICDLLDSQVSAIEGACGQIPATDAKAALSAAFDLIKERIAEFDDGDAAVPQAAEAVVPPSLQTAEEAILSSSPAPREEAAAAVVETMPAVSTTDTEAAISMPAEAIVATAEAAKVTAEVADVAAEALEVTAEAADARPEAADDYDEALLDMVALEMGAPDPDDIDDPSDEVRVAELPPAEPIIVAEKPEPMATPAQPPAVQPSLQPSPQASFQPSLGSTLIANGIVRRPHASLSDPLAPIRRMSQAEKIAFFS
jgi:hypothetical protein